MGIYDLVEVGAEMIEVLAKGNPIPHENLNGIEKLLENAKAGDIQGYCIAAIDRDGNIATAHYIGEHCHKMVGVLEYLKHKMFNYFDDL